MSALPALPSGLSRPSMALLAHRLSQRESAALARIFSLPALAALGASANDSVCRFELLLWLAGRKPCCIVGFGDGRDEFQSAKGAQWVDEVWEPTKREFEAEERAPEDLKVFLASVKREKLDGVGSRTGIRTGDTILYSITSLSLPLVTSVFLQPSTNPFALRSLDSITRRAHYTLPESEIASALGYPVQHPMEDGHPPSAVHRLELYVAYRDTQMFATEYLANLSVNRAKVARHWVECWDALREVVGGQVVIRVRTWAGEPDVEARRLLEKEVRGLGVVLRKAEELPLWQDDEARMAKVWKELIAGSGSAEGKKKKKKNKKKNKKGKGKAEAVETVQAGAEENEEEDDDGPEQEQEPDA